MADLLANDIRVLFYLTALLLGGRQEQIKEASFYQN